MRVDLAAVDARDARRSCSIPPVTVFVARRLVIFAISLFVASILVFVALSILPGDPAQAMLGTQATPQSLHELRHQLGLDRPLWVQYREWASGFVHGDFGVSAVSELPVEPQITSRLEVTGPLVLFGLLLATVGLAAARHHRGAPAPQGLGHRDLGGQPDRDRDPGVLGGHPAEHAGRGQARLAARRGLPRLG